MKDAESVYFECRATIADLTAQRDALLEALRACEISMSYLDEHTHFTIGAHNALAGAREAIARAEGKI